MVLFYCALVATAFAGYANPPNIAPAFSAYGSAYPTPYNSYPTPGYNMAPAYTSAPVIPPFNINPVYAGPSAYNLGYQTPPVGGYTVPPPPPPIPGYGVAPSYGGYKNSYQTGYNNYNPSYAGAGFNAGPISPNGPIYPSGGPVFPSGGPVLPSGGPILPNAVVNPAGVLPAAAFNNDPWAAISSPILRGAPTKQLSNSTITDEIVESKKRARL